LHRHFFFLPKNSFGIIMTAELHEAGLLQLQDRCPMHAHSGMPYLHLVQFPRAEVLPVPSFLLKCKFSVLYILHFYILQQVNRNP
jgi:hypothetical protein